MPNNNTHRYKTQALGVFHTDGLGGQNPNDCSQEYAGWTSPPTDKGFTNAGRVTLTQFNQSAQFHTDGIGVSPNDATSEYNQVLRQRTS